MSETELLDAVRRDIVTAVFAPGARLPNRIALQKRFSAGSHTIQQAMSTLVKEGVLVARGRAGTFVALKPPHLNRYAFVFPSQPGEGWSKYWQALLSEVNRLVKSGKRDISIYFILGADRASDDGARLKDDIANHRLAGVICAAMPWGLFDPPSLKRNGMALVAIADGANTGFLSVSVDHHAFFNRALQWLAARRCKRLAVLTDISVGPARLAGLLGDLSRFGMTMMPHYHLAVQSRNPASAEHSARLLMNLPLRERPDCLIIMDDNLVEAVTAGLAASGVTGIDDLLVVAHHNFPLPFSARIQVQHLGFEAREIVQSCLEQVDCYRRGEVPDAVTLVKPVFDDEVKG